ncbi:AzlC family ABC transporter permease [Fusobacterium massiliense]|uniref:AzlC family ABC transporter permease n=1 Tax=Fusobacterium massiliense TaxID=1852365 RepID=UPI0028D46CAE|nr:AzlC family ABC transporter permease [Fusobacterium massiliense]
MEEFKFAMKKVLPISFAYIFIGVAFGILMKEVGYGPLWSFLSALLIYGGSIQILMVGFLKNQTPLFSIFLISLFVNSRYIFYGLTHIDEFKKIKKESCLKYIFLVLTLTDEVYSVFTSSKIPNYLNRTKTMLWIAFIAYASWVLGCTVGGFISISIPGIDYVITEFFFLVMLSQLLLDKSYVPTTVGLFCSVAAFLLVGNNFILLAIIFSMLALLLLKKKLATNKGGKI